jgi:hypothetical protein
MNRQLIIDDLKTYKYNDLLILAKYYNISFKKLNYTELLNKLIDKIYKYGNMDPEDISAEQYLSNLDQNVNIINLSNKELTELPDLTQFIDAKTVVLDDNYIGPEFDAILLPPNIEELLCNNCNISLMMNLPKSLKYIECLNNKLTNTEAFTELYNLKQLHINNNNLYNINNLPNNIELLVCDDNNNLEIINNLPEKLLQIYLNKCNIKYIKNFNNNLKEIECQFNNLKQLPELPNGLKILNCSHNNLENLPQLPDSLIELNCTNNKLTDLPKLPEGLTELYCSDNKLKDLPNFPISLQVLECNNNSLPYFDIISWKNHFNIEIRPKEWYKICSEQKDITSQKSWEKLTNKKQIKDPIQIISQDGKRVECIERYDLLKWANNPKHQFTIWIPNNRAILRKFINGENIYDINIYGSTISQPDLKPLEDGPLFFKYPGVTNYLILLDENILHVGWKYKLQLINNNPIKYGNLKGKYGVSKIHGQEFQYVYELILIE